MRAYKNQPGVRESDEVKWVIPARPLLHDGAIPKTTLTERSTMSFYNVSAAPFDADKLDAIVKLASINMLDEKTAIALLGGTPVKPTTVITRNAERNLPTAGKLAHEKRARKAATSKVVRRDAVKPVHAAKAEVVKNAPTMRTIADGRSMPADAGTITKGQIKRLTDKGIKLATIKNLSMADAAELYAAVR